jgi:hypothetical protein
MDAFEISVRSNVKEIQKKLTNFAFQQLPFATAVTLTALAKKVKEEEVKQIKATFKNPSPFTVNSVRSQGARKNNLVAKVFVMDKAAAYLAPYEAGGVHRLPGKALLNPKDIALNQYGQLSRTLLSKLKARSDIYIGPIKTRRGTISGVWQREAVKATVTRLKGGKLVASTTRRGLNTSGRLKLLIRFGNALPVKKHLGYQVRAKRVVDGNFASEMNAALAKAMASSR